MDMLFLYLRINKVTLKVISYIGNYGYNIPMVRYLIHWLPKNSMLRYIGCYVVV